MTRKSRAIPLSFVRLVLLPALSAIALIAAPATASAGVFDFLFSHKSDSTQQDTATPAAADSTADTSADSDDDTADNAGADTATAPIADVAPSIETPLHHLYCVEYARARSGLSIFGDAKTWWASAKNVYDEFAAPAANAVMVFSGSQRIRRGHVAVVTAVVSPREIRVDQANWQNHGEIDHNTPVLDVSPDNDWSRVRVWNIGTRQFGAHVYAISGFIARGTPVSTGS